MARVTRSSAAATQSKPDSTTPEANISRKRSRQPSQKPQQSPGSVVNSSTRSKKQKNDPSESEAPVKIESAEDGTLGDGAIGVKGESTPVLRNLSPKKAKKDSYGLTPGSSPYPDYMRPTSAECKEVIRLLEKVHGRAAAPKAIPPPSLDVSGCGEVPSVLDALVRTRLSANTTNKNSSTAFQGLVKRFGIIEEGIGKGSVNWDAVRVAPQKEVFKAIERGGLADRKSKDIQAILQIAYEDNQARKQALVGPIGAELAGAKEEPMEEKEAEVAKAKHHIISLDHYHLLSTEDAINKMLELPGIGPKTASCVALFCMQRPSFAVDTHVFRLCQYLGWVPSKVKKNEPKVDRNTTYSHCDARIPDEYKYALHQLLIRHGKQCPRCRAATGQTSASWEDGCPIEHLVKRHGSKKGGVSQADRKRSKAAAGTKKNLDDTDEENGAGTDEEEKPFVNETHGPDKDLT